MKIPRVRIDRDDEKDADDERWGNDVVGYFADTVKAIAGEPIKAGTPFYTHPHSGKVYSKPYREPKVGDKVRITDEVGTPWGGLKGIISNINYGAYRIKVTYPDEYIHTFFSINQFEIVEPVKERYYFSEDDKPEVGQMVYVDVDKLQKDYHITYVQPTIDYLEGPHKVEEVDGDYVDIEGIYTYQLKYLYTYEPHDYAQGVLGRYPIKSMGSFGSTVCSITGE